MIVIPIQNQHAYNNIPRNKDLGLDIANHCDVPSKTLVVDWKGDCFVCGCEAWLPISVGKITDFENLADVWTSPSAKLLQQDIADKKYTHCAVDRCGIIHSNIVQDKYTVSINIDESCNLRCPSCRTEHIMLSSGDEHENKLAQVNHIVRLLENFTEPCHIVMSGNGDPLASSIMRPLIHNFRPRANQTIRLFTNGLLLKKQLEKSPIVNNITQYFISIDAGSSAVYERVRLGGQWNQLIDNLDYLKSIVDRTGAEVLLKFVLQQDNWHDMDNFSDLCIQYNFSGVINRLEDWGTWKNFNEHDVIGDREHPDHLLAMQSLRQAYSKYKTKIQFNASLVNLV
jgi:MoaA/NifB/PqqE/SkfB family radical SAM enzyme